MRGDKHENRFNLMLAGGTNLDDMYSHYIETVSEIKT